MQIFDLLQHQQCELDVLFDELQIADCDDAPRQFQAVSTRWMTSMRALHATVYPILAERGLDDEVRQAIRDHQRIESLINHVRIAALCPLEWREAVRELRTRVADHGITEQWTLCPMARLLFTAAELCAIADVYLASEPVATLGATVSITYDSELPEWANTPVVTTKPARRPSTFVLSTLSS